MKRHGPKVFLCHAHADRETVHALYSRLQKDGVRAWLDKENLQPGRIWKHEIRAAILESDVMVVCLSPHFVRPGGYRHAELRLALAKTNLLEADGVFIIPARLENCEVPKALRVLQRVDLFESGGYKKLVKAVWSR